MTDPRPAYNPTAEEIALRAWVVNVVSTAFSLTDVIYRNQRGPRPAAPYVDLQVTSDKPDGEPFSRVTNVVGAGGDYESTVTQGSHGTVSVTAYGSTSRDIIRALAISIQRGDVKDTNRIAGVNVVSTASVNDIPELLDTDYEQRTVGDFRFSFVRRYAYETPCVEKIIVTTEGTTGTGDIVEIESTID